MWHGDKIKISYICFVSLLLVTPNIIILGRLGIPESSEELIDGLFSIEYTVMLNKFLGAAIETGFEPTNGLSFLPQLALFIPSPIRTLLGIPTPSTEYLDELSSLAEVTGGGFSLLAQFYTDFGWFSPLIFVFLGLLIGTMNYKASKISSVSIFYACAPALFAMFLLTFRNDFGVFLKYCFQLFLVAGLLNLLINSSLGRKRYARSQI